MKRITILLTGILCCVSAFAQTNQRYLSVYYSSACCGTPSAQPVTDYLLKFQKENNLKDFEVLIETGLGKEGEHCFYIGLDNLNKKQAAKFVKEINNIADSQNKKAQNNNGGYVSIANQLVTKEKIIELQKKSRPQYGNKISNYNYKQ